MLTGAFVVVAPTDLPVFVCSESMDNAFECRWRHPLLCGVLCLLLVVDFGVGCCVMFSN